MRHVDPANVRRVRRELPPGYEVTAVSAVTAPPGIWGLGGAAVATPPRCAALADPAGGHRQSAQGVSGSGAGGTVYAVVVAASVALDQSLVAQCRQWSMTGRRAHARVHLVDPPRIDAAETLGMAVEIVTSVEGGNEIGSQASTFTAYLGDYYAFTTVVSDPGSPGPALTPQFAAELLVKTVSAVRG
jgi:hypothetical protein